MAYHGGMRRFLGLVAGSLVLGLGGLFGCEGAPGAGDAAVVLADAALDATADAARDAAPDAAPDLGPDPLEVDARLALARERYLAAALALDPADGFPKWVDGEAWVTSTSGVWTSGFFGGVLWLLARDGDPAVLDAARRWTAPLEVQAFNRGNHDVGFKIMPTFGAAARRFDLPADRRIVAAGADALASRFDPEVGCTRSWSHGEWAFPVIIDNLMNLEILLWAAAAGLDGDGERWRAVAVAHADRTAAEHVRGDGTTFHVVDYDAETGAVLGRMTHQGAADDSTWARGQAWALYGFVMVHRFTGEARHLDVARRTADAFLARLGDEPVPYWDFDAPDIPAAPRDASAAAVAASGLLELSVAADEPRYFAAAMGLLGALGAAPYLAEAGPSVLRWSVGHLPEGHEVSVPLVYADYYYVEALLRYRALRRGEVPDW